MHGETVKKSESIC